MTREFPLKNGMGAIGSRQGEDATARDRDRG